MLSAMSAQVLSLSFDLQVLLAGGVLGYFIAFSGYRRDHRTLEQAAFVVVFAAPAGFVLGSYAPVVSTPPSLRAIALALFCSLALGFAWRLAAPAFRRLVEQNLSISWDDTLPGAWQSMIIMRRKATQITVVLNDGSAVHCDNLSVFEDEPNGPCLLGFDGSIALCVTHSAPAESDDFEPDDPIDPAYGAKMTFIPASEIKRVHYRRLPQQSRRSERRWS